MQPRDEFGQIVGPLNDFVDQHVASRARLMEVEALLSRERDLGTAAQAELSVLQVTSAKTFGDVQDGLVAVTEREETIRRQDTQLTELRIRVSDLKGHADSLDARLFAEADRAKALADDNAILRQEMAIAEAAHVVTERNLVEVRESLGLTEAEASRLQVLTETMSLKIAGLNAHVANADKLIAHLRDQLHDKSDAFRIAETGLRDATAERLTPERRLESALEASSRTGTQLQETQRSNGDLANRADMLAEAVAAKDQAIEAANRRSATLLDRIEGLNARFALERSEFEATHRRMIEELRNERAERSLPHLRSPIRGRGGRLRAPPVLLVPSDLLRYRPTRIIEGDPCAFWASRRRVTNRPRASSPRGTRAAATSCRTRS